MEDVLMRSKSEVLEYLKTNMDRFSNQYGVCRIGVFGSVARGEATDASDIDILVEMREPTFDRYMDLKFEIEDALGASVDLVMEDTIKERLRPLIEEEAVYARDYRLRYD